MNENGHNLQRPWHRYYPETIRPSIDYPDIPLYQFADDAAKAFPDRAATIFFGARLSFKQLAVLIDRMAAALHALGVQKGDRVGLMLPNCPQVLIAYHAVLKVGGVVVQTSPMYVEREIEHQMNDSGAQTMIVLDLFYQRVRNVKEKTPLKRVIVTGLEDFMPFPLNFLYPLKLRTEGKRVTVQPEEGVYRFMELLNRRQPAPPQVAINPAEDLALLQYTGGTTGVAKGTMLTHRNLVANTIQSREWFELKRGGQDIILGALPFFHVYGMTVGMNLAMLLGATLIILPRFQVTEVLKTIQKYHPTLFPGAPAMYVAINNHSDVKKYDLTSIVACISGSAPLPVEVQNKFEALTGGKLVEGYGLTEASPVTHCSPIFGHRKIGTIGIPFPDTDCKIMDLATGETELPQGEVGELAIRGPQVMKGYWNRPEETKMALRDGWLYTGDIARMDEDGFFQVVDRKKDLIISGGFNIYPRDVEEILYEHPKVREVVVAGVPDAYRGEMVKAYVVLKDGVTATEEELIEFCRERLARYKVPRAIEFRAELPKNLVGKILRRVLVDEERKKLEKLA
ncbi:MAG: long-chain fatty acid--CoA ligase [Firmicutes bacterium]|nr:long-chain fatty acid--CoA ligase [Bacillota bacterium]